MEALLAGFALSGGLIVAIGAQNAFVLRQGLKRSYLFTVAALCTLIDWSLIVVGALGFGALVAAFPSLTSIAAWGGAVFLLFYGVLSFRSAMQPQALDLDQDPAAESRRPVILVTLAVSLLNPHVYLDTVVVMGGIAGQYALPERFYFTLGAGLASAVWFFSLAYGARLLLPLFRKPAAWQVLDVAIGVIMWLIALALIRGQVV